MQSLYIYGIVTIVVLVMAACALFGFIPNSGDRK